MENKVRKEKNVHEFLGGLNVEHRVAQCLLELLDDEAWYFFSRKVHKLIFKTKLNDTYSSEVTLYFSLWCREPSKYGVGLLYETQIQCPCARFSQCNGFVNMLQSLFKIFNILTIYTKSNFHTMMILNILNLFKASYAVLGSPINS